jgi:hypothetical protein
MRRAGIGGATCSGASRAGTAAMAVPTVALPMRMGMVNPTARVHPPPSSDLRTMGVRRDDQGWRQGVRAAKP